MLAVASVSSPGQDIGHRERRGLGKVLADRLLETGERRDRAGGDLAACRLVSGGHELECAVDLAAAEPLAGTLPELRLERPQFLGQAKTEIKVAMIDTANFPDEPKALDGALGGGKPGHAVRQARTPIHGTEISRARV